MFSGKRILILEGGGFKTSFTAGVLDAFMLYGYRNFDAIVAVSGGALAGSYYLSNQFGDYSNSIKSMCKDPNFISFSKAFSEGLINLNFFHDIADQKFPFNKQNALKALSNKSFYIVLTHSESGKTHYLQPNSENWVDMSIATSTVPMLTKGAHLVDNVLYTDGAISDPIPIQWVMKKNPSEVLLVRTTHAKFKPSIVKPEYVIAKMISANKKIKMSVENFQLKIKESIEIADTLQKEGKIQQIMPDKILNTNIFTNSIQSIILDYRHGVEAGVHYLHKYLKNQGGAGQKD
jgi:predicted patatin/cPLA2 family phospholipase